MDKVKMIVNHPLAKTIVCLVIGGFLIVENHPMYAGIALGIAVREFLLAFKPKCETCNK
tara:strand:+ start:99 stop:275 length:177 start_codon:yes stop_codon:yes gene_type:complete